MAYDRNKYSAAWNTANTTRIAISLNNRTDADIIDWLNSQENKQGIIKELIRKEMDRQQKQREH